MADTKTETPAARAETPARADAAPATAAEAAPKAAAAAAKPAAAKAARPRRQRRKAPAKRAPMRRTSAKIPAPQRTAARAATASGATKTNTNTINSINQGTRTMKNEAKQAADRFQAVFGDVNERAKGAFERNARIAEELTELTKGNVEALVASTKAAAKGVETLGQEVAEMSRKSFEDASAALKGFADVKSPTDFFRLQSDFARSQFDMIAPRARR